MVAGSIGRVEDFHNSSCRKFTSRLLQGLTTHGAGLKYRHIPAKEHPMGVMQAGSMTLKPPPAPEKESQDACKHPRVQIVAREEDAEFVECKECGEIFESSELRDMNIEETKLDTDS
jgi:hypothetical protein